MASATLDVKSFDQKAKNYGEIQINDWLFLNKADYRLMDYGASLVDVWAEGEYKLYKKTHLFSGVFYKDKIGNRGDLDNVKFYIWQTKQSEKFMPIYEDQNCFADPCPKVLISNESYFEEESGWVEYEKGMELEASEGRWRMEATRKLNKPIDFILEAHGKTFDEWAWWDVSWLKKKEITVENPNAQLNNYSVLLPVTYDSDMQNDFGDLRFTDSAETTELNYWIENKTDGVSANVWVYLPTVTGTGNTTIYMYYSNALVETTGDAGNTFLYGNNGSIDDFTNNLIGTCTASVDSGYIKTVVASSWSGCGVQLPYVLTSGKYVLKYQGRIDIEGFGGGLNPNDQTLDANSYNNNPHAIFDPNNANDYSVWDGSTQNFGSYTLGDVEQVVLTIDLGSLNGTTGVDVYFGTDGYTDAGARGTQNDIGYLQTAQFNTTLYMKNIYFREYQDTEPTIFFGAEEDGNVLDITSISPSDAYTTNNQSILFECNASDETGVYGLNLTLNGSVYESVTGAGNTNLTLSSLEVVPDGYYNWWCVANDDIQTKNSTIKTLTVDSTSPFINQSGLENLTTYSLPINSTWYLNASDTHLDQCYYNTTDHATSIVTCNSSINTTWATEGAKTITYCANDTFGNENCSSENIYIFSLSEDQADNPDPAVEGFDVTFNLTVNLTNIPTTTAYLVLNDTIYNPTTTQASANEYFFEVAFEVPNTWGNTSGITYDWYWNYTVDGVVTNQSTNTTNITVYELGIDNCSSFGDVILDMNLYDEETATAVNESAGARVEIDLALTSKTNSSVALTFNKTWINENNPQVCIPANVLNNTQWWLDFDVGFSSTDHVWEFYYLDDGTLNSSKVYDVQTSTPIYLMDILTTDSTSFLFNYFDQDGLPVEDAIVHVYRKYIGEGVFREVERAKADLNGDTIVHLVEEDVIYYFVISQYSDILFTSSQYTALCQATPCTIQIEASGDGATFPTDWDLIDGGAYQISSDSATRTVTMDYTLDDLGKMDLTVYKYNSDGSYSALNTTSETGTSGVLSMTVPQSAGNVSFFATVHHDDEFINSEWVDFEGKAQERFGVTLALFIGALIILTLGLISVSEGVGTLVYVLLGVALSGFLGLITIELSTGVNVIVYLILAGGILLWKLTRGRQ